MRRLFKIVFTLLLVICLQRFCHKQTDGFAREKICSSLEHHREWEVPALSFREEKTLAEILNQKFYYLSKGAQAYVFASEDGKYVLKFFRHSHMRPPFILILCSFPPFLEPLRIRKVSEYYSKLYKDFLSYKIAYEEMREETGLIFLHLNKTHALNKKLTFYDKIGIAHEVELDTMEFIVQHRAELIYPKLQNLMQNNQISAAKVALSSLICLLEGRFKKGISDKDPDLNTNFGFCETKAIQIDIGRFKKNSSACKEYKQEILRITDNLKQWLDARYPELSLHLCQEIQRL